MAPVHDKGVHGPGPYFDGPGPWTGSTEGVHGPGVHVLYFPAKKSQLRSSPILIVKTAGLAWVRQTFLKV